MARAIFLVAVLLLAGCSGPGFAPQSTTSPTPTTTAPSLPTSETSHIKFPPLTLTGAQFQGCPGMSRAANMGAFVPHPFDSLGAQEVASRVAASLGQALVPPMPLTLGYPTTFTTTSGTLQLEHSQYLRLNFTAPIQVFGDLATMGPEGPKVVQLSLDKLLGQWAPRPRPELTGPSTIGYAWGWNGTMFWSDPIVPSMPTLLDPAGSPARYKWDTATGLASYTVVLPPLVNATAVALGAPQAMAAVNRIRTICDTEPTGNVTMSVVLAQANQALVYIVRIAPPDPCTMSADYAVDAVTGAVLFGPPSTCRGQQG